MTTPQALAFTILASVVVLLIWDRWRYDLVASLALLAGMAVGIVPVEEAFKGFADDIVIIVASALVISAGIGRSGAVQAAMRPLVTRMRSQSVQVGVLAGAVTFLSAVMKNIGALAIFLPIALQVSQRNGTAPSRVLMPMSFGALIGGLMTLIGTSPNIIVSRMRQELLGTPFRMFDFTPVGLSIAVAGVAFLTVGWRLLPHRRQASLGQHTFAVADFTAEACLTAESSFVGRTVAELEDAGDGDVAVAAIIREGARRYIPAGDWILFADDTLVLKGDTHALDRIVADAGLHLVAQKALDGVSTIDDLALVEAVVSQGSVLIGQTVVDVCLRERYGTNLLALSRRGRPIRQRLGRVRFQFGDLVALQMRAQDVPETLATLGCLPLAARDVVLGRPRKRGWAVGILAVALTLVAARLVPVAPAFFGAAVAMVLFRVLSLKQAYDAIEWPILVLIGALLPVSEAVRTTGGTDLLAGWLSRAAQGLPPLGTLALVMIASMAITPFLNHAATVLVMAPIAVSVAQHLGLRPDPFLMAVAVGAACEFLTPVGHQCNTLVMGPGGYRFGDYARLGAPLALLVVVVGTEAISVFWPLTAH